MSQLPLVAILNSSKSLLLIEEEIWEVSALQLDPLMYIVGVSTDFALPTVTVVIHTYNQQNYVARCLQGVVEQDFFESMKILVIDDDSTDNTIDVCKSFQCKFPEKIEIVALEENQHSQGVLVGLKSYKSIKTKYIAWCDGDDYWIDRSKMRKQVEYLEQNPSIGVAHSDYFLLKENLDESEIEERKASEIRKANYCVSGRDLVFGNSIKNSTAVLLRKAIDFEFASSPHGIKARDWLIYISATQNLGIHFLDVKTTVVRVTENGIWNGGSVEDNSEQKNMLRWYCAAQLPDSELRELFRQRVVMDWIRNFISKSTLYKIVRPLVLMARYSKVQVKKYL